VTGAVADGRPPDTDGTRRLLAVLAVILLVVAFVPPLSTEARRLEYAQAVQFALFAIAVPALLVLGAPWRFLRLAAPSAGARPGSAASRAAGPVDRLQAARRRHPEFVRSLAVLALDVGVIVAWRVPAAVDALARHPWLVVAEAASLVACGVALWLECVASPPLTPRLAHPRRAALAAFAMWAVWAAAYVLGLAHASWYRAYLHVPGRGVSVWADQQLTTGVLWLAAICAFIPVIFWNLMSWLRTDDDPDNEMHRLVREGRRRSWAAAGAGHRPEPDR